MRGLKPWLIATILVIVAVALVKVARALRADPVQELRSELAVLRASADSCRTAVDSGEARLQSYSVRLDSMRARVRQLEGLHPAGVPADSYAVYLDVFRQYNDSAADYPGRVTALQSELVVCRGVTERHNIAADSLRRLLTRKR